MCLICAQVLLASVKARVNFTDCYPVICDCDRVCQIVIVCFVIKHSAHCAHVHSVGYPSRYYGVLRNTGVIPAVFERYFQGFTCTMGAWACSKSVEGI
jgi:hypothetical protein